MPLIHGFDPPERFVTGTVGEPGQRTFFLQARSGARITSVSLEKQQVAALSERIDQLLDEVMASDTTQSVIPAVAPLGLEDSEPLEQPIEEEFRAGTMTLSWDPDDERVVIEVFPYTEAAVVSPDQLDEELDRARAGRGVPGPHRRRQRPGVREARRAGARGRPADAARSAATRSTPRVTSASAPTASGDGTPMSRERAADR